MECYKKKKIPIFICFSIGNVHYELRFNARLTFESYSFHNVYRNKTKSCVRNYNFLKYAYDLEIFHNIVFANNCNSLQSVLNNSVQFHENNGLYLTLNKCYCMTFSRNLYNINYDYQFRKTNISNVSAAVIFNDIITVEGHI